MADKPVGDFEEMYAQNALIRPIEAKDDSAVATIIRDVLTEYGANRPGFAWQDPELDYMTRAYSGPGRGYWVIESSGKILGGGGIAEFSCELEAVCELQKMYLLPESRGRGHGFQLLRLILEAAREQGYQHCYLETMASMKKAARLYGKMGFSSLQHPLGDSGHNACDNWYLKALTEEA